MIKPINENLINLANTCNSNQISVDIFLGISHQYSIDLASFATIATRTGGSIYYYSMFNVIMQGEKLYYDLFRNLTRPIASAV
mmetsp:Transcript_48785/g.66402  ORF Transcript_48785/g.66402 Transcript_48785/m.66402 type:complete len:83 (+) Transcript_48785:415-663(+)